MAPSSCASEHVFSRWGTVCHHVEMGSAASSLLCGDGFLVRAVAAALVKAGVRMALLDIDVGSAEKAVTDVALGPGGDDSGRCGRGSWLPA